MGLKSDKTSQEKNLYGYQIKVRLPPERGEDSSSMRAAREMVTLAIRQPGFVGLETKKHNGKTNAYVIHWIDLESIDSWRAKIYESGLRRYDASAWHIFVHMEMVPNTRLSTAHHRSSNKGKVIHQAFGRVIKGFALSKSA